MEKKEWLKPELMNLNFTETKDNWCDGTTPDNWNHVTQDPQYTHPHYS